MVATQLSTTVPRNDATDNAGQGVSFVDAPINLADDVRKKIIIMSDSETLSPLEKIISDEPEAGLYALDWPYFNAEIEYRGGVVVHKLRRTQREARDGNQGNQFVNEAAKFFVLLNSETTVKRGGERRTAVSDNHAYDWLYGRLIVDATGYEVPFGNAFAGQLKTIHKKRALNLMSGYRVEIQHDQTQETMSGGTYVVRAWHGPDEDERLVGDFTFEFWNEPLQRAYRNSIAFISKRRGEDTIENVDVPMIEYLKVFDACIRSASGCGVTMGETVQPAALPELKVHTDDFLKMRLAVALVQHWENVTGN